jgi:hypothetical protein
MHLYYLAFVGGSLATAAGSAGECLEGARVVLRKGTQVVDEATTDWWGDFKFDKLAPNSGPYGIDISHPKFQKKHIEVESVGNSHYCGVVVMERA